MLLTIDAGNTNIVFAVYDGDKQLSSWRIHTDRARTADEYRSLVSGLYREAGLSCDAITDIIISSVVPSANSHLKEFCEKKHDLEPLFVGADAVKDRLNINLAKPEEVGADRVVNALAVREHYPNPAVVVDFGTATNFDVVGKDGAYEGGVIAPGVNLSIDALHRAAAKLPMVDVAKPEKAIGKNTVEAMQSGIYLGYVSLIEGMLARIEEELSEKPYVIATGGLAPLFADGTDKIDIIDQDLTLKGLLEIYNDKK